MAVKSKAEVRTVLRTAATLLDGTRTYLAGTHTTNVAACLAAIEAGDTQIEDATQLAALEAVQAAAGTLHSAVLDYIGTLHPTLGRYASSPNLADPNANISAFFDNLVTASEEVLSRGFTKFTSWTPGGSNIGNGTFCVFNNNPNGQSMDLSHVETLTIRCVEDEIDGTVAGSEGFIVIGQTSAEREWLNGGSAGNGGYRYQYGVARKDFGPTQDALEVTNGSDLTPRMFSVGPTQAQGNLLADGDFEGGTLSDNWTADAAGWAYDTTDEIAGSQSVSTATNSATISQPLVNNLVAKGVYFLQAYCGVEAGGSGEVTGNLTFKVKDDSTTHVTITVDLSTLTAGTPIKATYAGFVLPETVGTNLRVEIQMGTIGGTGTGKKVVVDNIVLTRGTIIDGGRAVAVLSGLANWRLNDVATGATTISESGKIQRAMNLSYSRYLPHVGSGDYWTDS